MPRPRAKRPRITRPTPARERLQSSASPAPVIQPGPGAPSSGNGFDTDIYDVSDREKERSKLRKEAAQKHENEAAQDAQSGRTRRTRASQGLALDSEQAKALEDARRKRDDAMNRLDDITSTSKASGDVESPEIEYSRRESTGTAVAGGRRVTDASGLDLDDMMFGELDDSLDLGDDTEHAVDDTQDRGHGHRSATDNSSFNVALFRRGRPRQSSVAGRDDAPIRPSSRGAGPNTPSISSVINFGKFKRRAREPSILGTAQKDRTARSLSQASQASRQASILADDDSGPEGESTPLDRTRRLTARAASPRGDDMSPVLPTRKRKSLDNHYDENEGERGDEKKAETEEVIHPSIEVDSSPPLESSPPRGRTRQSSIRRRTPTPPRDENDPDTMPPLSSSASESTSPVNWPSMDALAHRNYARKAPAATRAHKTPELADDVSDVSSPPSLTHSPNYAPAAVPKARAAKKKAPPAPKAPPKITTADLTSLLPRRRHPHRSERQDPFALDSSDEADSRALNSDEDELSYVDSRAAARRRAAKKVQPLGKSAPNKGKNKGKGKEAPTATTTAAAAKRKNRRTYGAQPSDKENEGDEITVAVDDGSGDEGAAAEEGPAEAAEEYEEENSQMVLERLGEELQKARKKFKEVDKWELSFEEVVRSSSPVDAR